jgi:hypothetical protein
MMSFFFFFGLKIFINVKNKCDFFITFFWGKKSLDLEKIKNLVVTFNLGS